MKRIIALPAGAADLLTKPGGHKTVFTCTIVVKKRGPEKFHLHTAIIGTGSGGEAGPVARNRPAG